MMKISKGYSLRMHKVTNQHKRKEMNIENYREGPQKDNDKSIATFDVEHKGSRYIDLRVLISKSGKYYIAYPSKKRVGHDGQDSWIRYYDWGKERNIEFDKMVLEALEPYLSGSKKNEALF